jgi:hypothetical protein
MFNKINNTKICYILPAEFITGRKTLERLISVAQHKNADKYTEESEQRKKKGPMVNKIKN